MMGMSSSIRIGVPTATDPAGLHGQGYWWITGNARPALVPERRKRVRRRKRIKPGPDAS
jgi:hypothetical protein